MAFRCLEIEEHSVDISEMITWSQHSLTLEVKDDKGHSVFCMRFFDVMETILNQFLLNFVLSRNPVSLIRADSFEMWMYFVSEVLVTCMLPTCVDNNSV